MMAGDSLTWLPGLVVARSRGSSPRDRETAKPSPRYGNLGQDPGDKLLLGRRIAAQSAAVLHQNAVRQHWAGEALDVFGDDEVASADHRQRLTSLEIRERAACGDAEGHFGVVARGVHDVHQIVDQRLIDVNGGQDRKSTRLNSSHVRISYAVF